MSDSTLFNGLRNASIDAQHAVEKSALRAAANLGQTTNAALMIELAKMSAVQAEHASASKFLANTRTLTNNADKQNQVQANADKQNQVQANADKQNQVQANADKQNQVQANAGMFSRPSFSSVERTGVQAEQAPDSTPSVSPTA